MTNRANSQEIAPTADVSGPSRARWRVILAATAILGTLVMLALFLAQPGFLRLIEYKTYDVMLRGAGPADAAGPVPCAVAAIDEKALARYGQWPWPRYRVAELLDKLKSLGAAAIGLDVMFPEPDRTSPVNLHRQLLRDRGLDLGFQGLPPNLMDNDRLLAASLAGDRAYLGYVFLFAPDPVRAAACAVERLKLAVLSPAQGGDPARFALQARGVVCNIPLLQGAAAGNGFLNAFRDEDGILRRTPLLIHYRGAFHPSLGLATLMGGLGLEQAVLGVGESGLDYLLLGQRYVPLDASGSLLINYRLSDGLREVSAADVLDGSPRAAELKGKVVFVGLAAKGTHDLHSTPLGGVMAGVEAHALIGNSILAQDFIARPQWTRGLEAALIVACGLLAGLMILPINPLWGGLVLALAGFGLWTGAEWLLVRQSLYVSPLMGVATLAVNGSALAVMKLSYAMKRVRDLRLAKERADQASRFKGEFLANMSHEIRNPMNAILGLADLSLHTDLNPKQRDYLEKISLSARSLLRIVNDVLDISKVEAGKLDLEEVPFALSEVLDSLGAVLALPAQEKGLELVFRVAPGTPEGLVGDPVRLGQVLINLANNAVKFTREGEVVVSVAAGPAEGDAALLEFRVQDSGEGIDPESQARLFRPFAQAEISTHRLHGGTGLGLNISRRLVRLMGGDISLRSTPGRGSTFSFSIPLGLDTSEAESRGESPVQSHTALAADDNPAALDALLDGLTNLGLAARGYATAGEALEALAASDGSPDFLLLDWSLPDLDPARLAEIAGHSPDAPAVIILTEHGAESVVRRAEGTGLRNFLAKPVTPRALERALAGALAAGHAEEAARPDAGGEPERALAQKARILLVDDNAINRQVAREVLARRGLAVTEAADGQEALELLEAGGIDLVLMDVHMPGMDGYEATRRIRRTPGLTDLPVLAMTAQATREEREQCLEAGMNGHLAKPIDPAKLYASLEKYLGPLPEAEPEAGAMAGMPAGAAGLRADGLDAAAGLDRLDGNRELYLELLEDFAARFADVAGELEALQASGDADQALALLHNLKGVSANLGAMGLSELAAVLERGLKRGQEMPADGPAGLRRGLEGIAEAVRRARAESPERQPSPHEPTGTDGADLADHLARLRDSLAANSLDSDRHLAQVEDALAGRGPANRLEKLRALVDGFDFPGALGETLSLAAEVGVELAGERHDQ